MMGQLRNVWAVLLVHFLKQSMHSHLLCAVGVIQDFQLRHLIQECLAVLHVPL